jgi:hypothetical protein
MSAVVFALVVAVSADLLPLASSRDTSMRIPTIAAGDSD